MAEQIAENGPAFLSDLAGRQNDLYVFHEGGDYSEGWTAVGVFVPDMDGCVVEWDAASQTFEGRVLKDHAGDEGDCAELSFDSEGTGLVHFRIWSDENRLKIDVNGGDIS